ncbi:MAG: hypothetical protein PSV23_14605 [Brevundimonas sp.]|uniref:DUF7002 family protein n=1 Tax=Brevundimonas sp. TaxID=1871086 RepID=UPI002488F763|nr:hypothetical protein [Brevundimonas sp.]MDI1328019.1 hypothetical protein [Brevundimonas sp.]
MTPEDLAALHPKLYHVAASDALEGVRRHGLLSTSRLLDLFGTPPEQRGAIERRRRPTSIALQHPAHGRAVITDNIPLSETALAACLDDGLTAAEWLQMLNGRVFFWPDEKSLAGLLGARANAGAVKRVLVFDTLGLARRHAADIELAAFNTGNTRRKPVRRGLATFTPMLRHSYGDWRRLRRRLDVIREVTVVGGVPDAADYLIDDYLTTGGAGGGALLARGSGPD